MPFLREYVPLGFGINLNAALLFFNPDKLGRPLPFCLVNKDVFVVSV